ncbi:uncharacterized protein LOC143785634 isoform X2 [Ranitomeya variabilis]|uniref:uncharacterized protein LOC143785634 isoform X2 n=1 Tax=Ranitomeya variabilis TaxID=490064 RepID=UPI004055D7EA
MCIQTSFNAPHDPVCLGSRCLALAGPGNHMPVPYSSEPSLRIPHVIEGQSVVLLTPPVHVLLNEMGSRFPSSNICIQRAQSKHFRNFRNRNNQ